MEEILDKCRKYYINLEQRVDRKKHITDHLSKYFNDDVERVNAIIDNEDGFMGCTKSHLLVIQDAIFHRHEMICVFEDDFEFLISPQELHTKQVPQHFNVIQLAHTKIISSRLLNYNDVVKVDQSLTSSGLIIHKNYFEQWKHILLESLAQRKPLDIIMQNYQSKAYWYAFRPPIARQIDSISNIS